MRYRIKRWMFGTPGSFAFRAKCLIANNRTSGAYAGQFSKKNRHQSPSFRYHLDEHNLIEGGSNQQRAVLLEWFSSNFLNEPMHALLFNCQPGGAEQKG